MRTYLVQMLDALDDGKVFTIALWGSGMGDDLRAGSPRAWLVPPLRHRKKERWGGKRCLFYKNVESTPKSHGYTPGLSAFGDLALRL